MIVPGNSKSVWNAVNLAKDINPNKIPPQMTHEGTLIVNSDLSDAFADFFDMKVKNIVTSCKVEDDIYNGRKNYIAMLKISLTNQMY